MTLVKICGLSTPGTLEAAVAAGADFVGFVIYAKSPRNVLLTQARDLVALVDNRARTVALVVDADDTALRAINDEVAPDIFQAHGAETPARIAAMKALTRKPVMKAIKVGGPQDVAAAKDYVNVADLILFDAEAPASLKDALPGGNGEAFDWSLLADEGGRSNFMLSGGLASGNVAMAIRVTGAAMVDVSSGVESSPGIKDISLIRKFIEAAKAKGWK